MIAYLGSFENLIINWQSHGPMGKFARDLWDGVLDPILHQANNSVGGWNYLEYVKALKARLSEHGADAKIDSGMTIKIEFGNPDDYLMFCLRMG